MFSDIIYAQEAPREQDGLGCALEELLKYKGNIRFDVGITYNAKSGDDISAAYQTIETGTGEFVSVPVNVGLGKRETDFTIGTLSARYGWSISSLQGADEVPGKSRSVRQTRGELEFGVAYAVNPTTTFRANAQAEVVGQKGLTVGISLAKNLVKQRLKLEGAAE